jgi:Common central domain of tyrosinase/Polyphenol oxidase middle domain
MSHLPTGSPDRDRRRANPPSVCRDPVPGLLKYDLTAGLGIEAMSHFGPSLSRLRPVPRRNPPYLGSPLWPLTMNLAVRAATALLAIGWFQPEPGARTTQSIEWCADSTPFTPGTSSQEGIMAQSTLGRREFVAVTAAAGAALGPWSGLVPGPEERPPDFRGDYAGPLVRRNVFQLDPAGPELSAYRQGIQQMKAWSAANPSDPRGWTYQAAIHGTTTTPAQAAWNTCPHHSYYFFTWHRAYLYYFERIIRKASGVASFALPYWNYSIQGMRQLPAPFEDTASPLYHTPRTLNGGGLLDPNVVNYVGDFAPLAFSSTLGAGNSLVTRGFGGAPWATMAHGNSSTYGGTLENHIHDLVHVGVGGDMGQVNTAARDPIFWLHHANIDRLWNRWLEYGQPGSGRANPTADTQWMNASFSLFDENGTAVTITAQQVLQTTKLGYRYDDDPCPPTILVTPTPYRPPKVIVIDCRRFPFLCPREWNPRVQDPWKVLTRFQPAQPVTVTGAQPTPLDLKVDPRAFRDLRRLFAESPTGRELEIVLNLERTSQLPILVIEAQRIGPRIRDPERQPWIRVGQIAFFESAEERKARPRETLQTEITQPVKDILSEEWTDGDELRWRARFVTGALSRTGQEIPPPKDAQARIHSIELRVR